MGFNENDIDTNLQFTGNHPQGLYNQLQWSVQLGNDATQRLAQIVSIHEFFHNELNNTTVYGSLLQAYAFLSRAESPRKETFKILLAHLIQQCRVAHETYATWLSIAVFSRHSDEDLARIVLADNEEYNDYYQLGQSLVNDLPSLYLRQQVLTASIRFCFQSQTIAQTALDNVAEFTVSAIRGAEFPNQRLAYIAEQLTAPFLRNCVEEYIRQKQETPVFNLLNDALQGHQHTDALLTVENDYIAQDLMHHVYESLRAHFDTRGSNSVGEREHLIFFEKLLARMQDQTPVEQAQNSLIPNTAPDDYNRSMVVSFENETILLTDKPLKCLIRHPEEFPPEQKEILLRGIGDEPHLFVIGRLSMLMQEQYHFVFSDDEAWLNQINGPFTALRYSYLANQERIVVLVPFATPEELNRFLADKHASVPIYGCAALSAAYQSTWWQIWGEFFADQCETSCFLMDVSPLHYVEQVFSHEELVYYAKAIVNTGDRAYTALVFQVITDGLIQATLVAPCSDLYCSVLHNYMKHRYNRYQHDADRTNIIYGQLPTVLSHLFREEHSFYFRSHNTQFL